MVDIKTTLETMERNSVTIHNFDLLKNIIVEFNEINKSLFDIRIEYNNILIVEINDFKLNLDNPIIPEYIVFNNEHNNRISITKHKFDYAESEITVNDDKILSICVRSSDKNLIYRVISHKLL